MFYQLQRHPLPVKADCAFLRHEQFQGVEPVLANAFHVQNIPYMWKRGVRHQLPAGAQA